MSGGRCSEREWWRLLCVVRIYNKRRMGAYHAIEGRGHRPERSSIYVEERNTCKR